MTLATALKTVPDIEKTRLAIQRELSTRGTVILPPMDAVESMGLLSKCGLHCPCTMLDPWYNKGFGGVRSDYNEFIAELLATACPISDHVYLWGFPEIVARFVDFAPKGFTLNTWLTWYYKNNPSVIRGWRSSQMACLHYSRPSAPMYPENFMNGRQLELQSLKKLRYIPGPTSVIEEPLNVGFVHREEQTGYPAQKPLRVFQQLLLMVTQPDEVVVDPMCGSGTTGDAARVLGRKAILCDMSDEAIQVTERRLNLGRLKLA